LLQHAAALMERSVSSCTAIAAQVAQYVERLELGGGHGSPRQAESAARPDLSLRRVFPLTMPWQASKNTGRRHLSQSFVEVLSVAISVIDVSVSQFESLTLQSDSPWARSCPRETSVQPTRAVGQTIHSMGDSRVWTVTGRFLFSSCGSEATAIRRQWFSAN
jgi:hypothetical protein